MHLFVQSKSSPLWSSIMLISRFLLICLLYFQMQSVENDILSVGELQMPPCALRGFLWGFQHLKNNNIKFSPPALPFPPFFPTSNWLIYDVSENIWPSLSSHQIAHFCCFCFSSIFQIFTCFQVSKIQTFLLHSLVVPACQQCLIHSVQSTLSLSETGRL